MFSAAELQALAASKRDAAGRARRLADQLSFHDDQERLRKHADELDAEAADLEREAMAQRSS